MDAPTGLCPNPMFQRGLHLQGRPLVARLQITDYVQIKIPRKPVYLLRSSILTFPSSSMTRCIGLMYF